MSENLEPLAIRVEGLSVEYEFGLPVLYNMDLTVREGTICALLGRNGSGKTTLLQTLYGLLEPEEGEYEVLGLDPFKHPVELRRRVGYVPQSSHLLPEMTAEDHLDFMRPLYGGRWNRDLEYQLVQELNLERCMSDKVKTLSTGQSRLLSLMMALAFEPDLLLLDEPTVFLDLVVRHQFAKQLVEFAAQPGRTVLMASHMIHEVERLADHVIFLGVYNSVIEGNLEDLKQRLLCFEAEFDQPIQLGRKMAMKSWRFNTLYGAIWTTDSETALDIEQELRHLGAKSFVEVDPSLESLFTHLTQGS